jgi:hypothetical protein
VLDLFSFYDLAPAVVHRVRTFELQRSLVANSFGVALIYTRPFVTVVMMVKRWSVGRPRRKVEPTASYWRTISAIH